MHDAADESSDMHRGRGFVSVGKLETHKTRWQEGRRRSRWIWLLDKRRESGGQGKSPRIFVVTEMPREWPVETIYEITGWFQRGFRGECEAAQLLEDRETGLLVETRRLGGEVCSRPSSCCPLVRDCEVVFFGFGGDAEGY